jgi:putative transposase
MSRLRRIADRDRIFFVTTNLVRGVRSLSPAERDLILLKLEAQRVRCDFCLFGYVVMPTHLHLLLAPDQSGLIDIMRRLKRFTAQRIAKDRDQEGALWQARYFDFVLRRVADFWDKLEYIHENPQEARLVDHASAWSWSSAAQYEKGAPVCILKVDRIDLPADRNALLYPAPWR